MGGLIYKYTELDSNLASVSMLSLFVVIISCMLSFKSWWILKIFYHKFNVKYCEVCEWHKEMPDIRIELDIPQESCYEKSWSVVTLSKRYQYKFFIRCHLGKSKDLNAQRVGLEANFEDTTFRFRARTILVAAST